MNGRGRAGRAQSTALTCCSYSDQMLVRLWYGFSLLPLRIIASRHVWDKPPQTAHGDQGKLSATVHDCSRKSCTVAESLRLYQLPSLKESRRRVGFRKKFSR